MERWKIHIVELTTTTGHKVIAEGYLMCLVKPPRCIFVSLEHLGDHDLSQRILVNAARSLMNEHIVIDFCEACDTVIKRNGRVETEQGQVKVSPRHIFRLKCV